MKPIEKLRQAILDYEKETETFVKSIHLKDRTFISDKSYGVDFINDFNLVVKTNSY